MAHERPPVPDLNDVIRTLPERPKISAICSVVHHMIKERDRTDKGDMGGSSRKPWKFASRRNAALPKEKHFVSCSLIPLVIGAGRTFSPGELDRNGV